MPDGPKPRRCDKGFYRRFNFTRGPTSYFKRGKLLPERVLGGEGLGEAVEWLGWKFDIFAIKLFYVRFTLVVFTTQVPPPCGSHYVTVLSSLS